jgi:hypothetical protein
LSGLLGHALEASVIAIIVLFALLLGFIQEYRAERALEALRKMAAPLGHVIRDVERSIPSRDVVPGDLVVLRAGDRVPADCRITTAVNVYVPWLQGPFATFGLSVGDWILVTVLALTVVPVLEAVKWMERHEWFGELV